MSHRALIVDDSRSARVVLTRMLESFGLTVDSVESAEQALTYLQTQHPDVIFLDHLMPGMDGFAAVRVLKANPHTAAIPVLMYTAQAGEMYLSQARALGALGVLPKTLKSTDVAAVLQQLKLDTRPEARTATHEVVVESVTSMADAPTPMSVTATAQLAHRIASELSAELPTLKADVLSALRFWRLLAISLGVLLLVGLSGAFYLLYQTRGQLQQVQVLQRQLQDGVVTSAQFSAAAADSVRVEPSTATSAAISLSTDTANAVNTAATTTVSEPYAYGEVPLAGARLERLRNLVNELKAKAQQASIRVQIWSADFCLSGNASGYELAAADALLSRCEVLGNPFADALSVQQRQSVAFANWLATVNNKDGISIQILDAGHQAWTNYPERLDNVTAETWNAAAARNQRVDYLVSVHGS